MKKIAFMLVCFSLMASLVACTTTTTTTTPSLTIDSEAAEVSADDYEKTLEGLVSYLKDNQTLSGDEPTIMSYDFIGAIAGEKYTYTYEGATVTCELYEFDLENLDDAANEVIDSTVENGYFICIGDEVEAVISNNHQFLMVFTISTSDDVYVEFEESIVDYFTNFA